LFLSSRSRSTKTVLLELIVIVIMLTVIPVINEFLINRSNSTGPYDSFSILRSVFAGLNQMVSWISPISHLNIGIQAVEIGIISQFFLVTSISFLIGLIFVYLSILMLRRKGIRRL
jgi:hypothetical protein